MDDVKQMLFTLQRFQVLTLFTSSVSERTVSESYAYAWAHSVYPFLNRSAVWHAAYESCFEVREAPMRELHTLLETRWREEKLLTFFELEDVLGIRGTNRPGPAWDQSRLVRACRYLHLHAQFDVSFWSHLLGSGQAPSLAAMVAQRFEGSEIFFE